MAINDLEWFEIHLEHIDTEEDFAEAMEMAHVKGFEDGYSAGEEEGYNDGIYSSVVEEKIEKAVLDEQERIISVAWDWISEMRGHDGDCSCRHEASILQQFIEHPDFKGEQK